jgi:hypothetical protein
MDQARDKYAWLSERMPKTANRKIIIIAAGTVFAM